MIALAFPAVDFGTHSHNRPIPALYRRAAVIERGSLPCFGQSGTGGVEGVHFVLSRQGYSPFAILKVVDEDFRLANTSSTDLMSTVRTGFGRNMSHLPAVFGVSRQSLYNWLSGETPKEHHQKKLVQLAAAARVFVDVGFKPTAPSLRRTIAQGKSFIELLGQGADGKETAERLVRIEKRGSHSRKELDVLLAGRARSRPDVAEMGRPSLFGDV
jgi:transcriptional regulator with XRE-family HTH domain